MDGNNQPIRLAITDSATPTAAPAADRPTRLSEPFVLAFPILRGPYFSARTSDTTSTSHTRWLWRQEVCLVGVWTAVVICTGFACKRFNGISGNQAPLPQVVL